MNSTNENNGQVAPLLAWDAWRDGDDPDDYVIIEFDDAPWECDYLDQHPYWEQLNKEIQAQGYGVESGSERSVSLYALGEFSQVTDITVARQVMKNVSCAREVPGMFA